MPRRKDALDRLDMIYAVMVEREADRQERKAGRKRRPIGVAKPRKRRKRDTGGCKPEAGSVPRKPTKAERVAQAMRGWEERNERAKARRARDKARHARNNDRRRNERGA